MKTILLSVFSIAALLPLRAGSFKNNDVIEHFANQDEAMARIQKEIGVTAKATFSHVTGACMGLPTDFYACVIDDFAHTKVGDRVNFMTKFIWPGEAIPLDPWRKNGPEPFVASHRVVWIEKDGTLAVQQDRWPWKTEYVTPKNYRGTYNLMAVWDKK